MECNQFSLGRYECVLLSHSRPDILIVQPVGADAIEYLRYEDFLLRTGCKHRFALFAFTVHHWEQELAPWHDPLLSKNDTQETGAHRLLQDIVNSFIPFLRQKFGHIPTILAGYSLAGLFALWCGYHTDCFDAIAGVSPSVWIGGWCSFSQSHYPHTHAVYLSQGDKEGKTRHPIFAQVTTNIIDYHHTLCTQLGSRQCCLEWNKGNHFIDTDKRTARGIIWCMNHILSPSSHDAKPSQI